MSAPNTRTLTAIWRRFAHYVRDYLLAFILFCIFFAVVLFFDPVRLAAPFWVLGIAWAGMWIWPIIFIRIVYDSIVGPDPYTDGPVFADMTPNEVEALRKRQRRNLLIALLLTILCAGPVWFFIEFDFARWTLVFGLFCLFTVAVHFFTSKDRVDFGGSDDTSGTAERALREQIERELKESKR